MSTDTPNSDSATGEPDSRTISLTWDPETEQWNAVDEDRGVASCGETREEALEMLDEAVALHIGETGDSIDDWEGEREVLEDLDIDPEDVKAAREDGTELPDFLE